MNKALPFKNPLCVALDVDSKDQALRLVSELKDIAGGFKLGPRLIHRYGEDLVKEISQHTPVFVDCKFFDIPSTMLAAVRSTFEAGASATTVHALSGHEALVQLAGLEAELNKIRPFRILAVTILTSWNDDSFPVNFVKQSISSHVEKLADLVKHSGLTGVVCSPHEIELLRAKNLFLLTPGIRFADGAKDDQKRVLGPKEAIQMGSSVLVVGRPIIEAASPKQAALAFLQAINQA